MTRWNPCCCAPNPIGLTGDIVLVRAGWYHFMAMTLDGRVNCYIGAGLEGNKPNPKGVTFNGLPNRDLRRLGAIDCDWARVHDSVMFTNEDNGGSGVVKVGTPDPALTTTWFTIDEWQADVLVYVPVDSARYNAPTWYNCSTPVSAEGIVGNQDTNYRDGGWLFNTARGACRSNPFSGFSTIGCWYNKNKIYAYDNTSDYNTNFINRYWPHGYMEFDGSGCTVSRPWRFGGYTYAISGNTYPSGATVGFAGGVTGERWQYLITKMYGTLGDTLGITFENYLQQIRGVDGITFWYGEDIQEEYKPVAIVAPAGHPLHVPTLPTIGEGDQVRPLKVIDIECGSYHNIIRLEDNTIMCWGLNSMGQCNVPESLKAGITLGRHPKIDNIVSLHAGFSTSAVLFNDGTALCWGDPEVACAVNNWSDIRVSPIKRHNDIQNRTCIGAGSDGYPDPNKPYYPANKHDNSTYNANTDWFQYWRKGTPAYPHFDLGVEVNPIYPVNWSVLGNDGGFGGINNPIVNRNVLDGEGNHSSSFSVFDPKVWCEDCHGLTIGKDFAVGMLRSGQIVTSRKENTPTAGKSLNLSRDCSTDTAYYRDTGTMTPPDGGVHVLDQYYCCGGGLAIDNPIDPTYPDIVINNMNPNQTCFQQLYNPNSCQTLFCDQNDFLRYCGGTIDDYPQSCKGLASIYYPEFVECTQFECDSYKRWLLPEEWLTEPGGVTCTDPDKRKNIFNLPEGIGCYSQQIGEQGYDANWASTSLYTAGQQVRNDNFSGGRYPSWNIIKTGGTNSPGVNYGWSTLAAVSSRYQPGTLNDNAIVPACRAEEVFPERCAITQGPYAPCNYFCPSSAGGFYSTQMGGLGSSKGIPGLFRYPEHIVGTLTCVAGVNTVAWVSRSKLIQPETLALATANDWITESHHGLCERYHLNDSVGANREDPLNRPQAVMCSECGVVGYNPGEHIQEVGDTTYGCIYANHPDADGFNNPFRESTKTGWCKPPITLARQHHMLPSRPWGPWNLQTDVGYATPNIMDYAICHRKLLPTAVYVSYENAGQGDLGLQLTNLPWKTYLGPGMPYWFMGCDHRSTSIADSYPTYETLNWDGAVMGYYYPNSLSYWYIYDNITSQIRPGRDEQNPEDSVLNEDGTSRYDCYRSNKTCGCAPNKISYLWANDARTHCDSGTSSIVEDPERSVPGWPGQYAPPLSGQPGATCGVGIEDAINRWCFNNPSISYATGRSFAVHVRACPWIRGLSGEFIWKNACEENKNYFKGIGRDVWLNSTSNQTKTLKLWISGIMEDPCPPWPVDVNVNGITFGRYPSWVPVPSTNTIKHAQKGQWSGVEGEWSSCLSGYEWNFTAWGYTLGCTASGCISGEISWPSGVTGCTLGDAEGAGSDDQTPIENYPHGWNV